MKKSYLTYEERKFIVESIKYVDEVIPEEHWDQKPNDIKKYGIDIVASEDAQSGGPSKKDEELTPLKRLNRKIGVYLNPSSVEINDDEKKKKIGGLNFRSSTNYTKL